MNVVFKDLQNTSNPLNGTVLHEPAEVGPLFESLRGRAPFVLELAGDNGYKLTIGLSEDLGFVQHGATDGSPPYLLAVADVPEDDGAVEFLAGNTPTPIPHRYCLPMAVVHGIAREFLFSGNRRQTTAWEEA